MDDCDHDNRHFARYHWTHEWCTGGGSSHGTKRCWLRARFWCGDLDAVRCSWRANRPCGDSRNWSGCTFLDSSGWHWRLRATRLSHRTIDRQWCYVDSRCRKHRKHADFNRAHRTSERHNSDLPCCGSECTRLGSVLGECIRDPSRRTDCASINQRYSCKRSGRGLVDGADGRWWFGSYELPG